MKDQKPISELYLILVFGFFHTHIKSDNKILIKVLTVSSEVFMEVFLLTVLLFACLFL